MRSNSTSICSTFLLLGLLSSLCLAQHIIDYSYSKQLEELKDVNAIRLNIHPNDYYSSFNAYQFPFACQLHNQLASNQTTTHSAFDITEYDAHIAAMKARLIEMLQVSEKIRKSKIIIHNFQQEFASTNTNIKRFQVEDLQKYEIELKSLQESMKIKTREIQDHIYLRVRVSEGSIFRGLWLKYELRVLIAKLAFLQRLLVKSLAGSKSQETEQKFEVYFSQIHKQFVEENGTIVELVSIFSKYGRISQLRGNLSILSSKISILKLSIPEKQKCLTDKKLIKDGFSNEEIHSSILKLKEMKSKESEESKKYCQGASAKITIRLKQLLTILNLMYTCSEGLEDQKEQLRRIQDKYNRILAEIKALEGDSNLEKFIKFFKESKQFLQVKKKSLQNFQIEQYQTDPNLLKQLIKTTEQQIGKLKADLEQLPNEKVEVIDFRLINYLVLQIKQMKVKFCERNSEYQVKAQRIWNEIAIQKERSEIRIERHNKYLEEMNHLRQLEIRFVSLKRATLEMID